MLPKFKLMKLLVLFFAASVFLTGCGNPSEKSDSSAATTEQKAEEHVITVSAKEYYKKYQENEVAADNLYKGKKISIVGNVESINKDFADDAYISLAGDGEISMGVQCHLTDAKKAATVKKESEITIVGTGDGMTMGIPQVKDCVIQ